VINNRESSEETASPPIRLNERRLKTVCFAAAPIRRCWLCQFDKVCAGYKCVTRLSVYAMSPASWVESIIHSEFYSTVERFVNLL